MPPPELIGAEKERLHAAMLSAFRDPNDLRRLVSFRFNPVRNTRLSAGQLDDFTEGPVANRIAQLIEKAEADGWTSALVFETHDFKPGALALAAFHDRYFTSVQRSISSAALERIVVAANAFIDPVIWRDQLASLEGQVCRVEAGTSVGTGFLVGPDVIVTNYHVVEPLVNGSIQPQGASVTFDYKNLGTRVISPGVVIPVAADWRLALSPVSPVDEVAPPKPRDATRDELDYAFVRLARQVGQEPGPHGGLRGWIKNPNRGAPLVRGSAMYILQHPNGEQLKLAMGTDAVLDVNGSGTRVTYTVNTEPGSSGSPCFNQKWELVALHHSGDPAVWRSAEFNEGIPIAAIASSLPAATARRLEWT